MTAGSECDGRVVAYIIVETLRIRASSIDVVGDTVMQSHGRDVVELVKENLLSRCDVAVPQF
jgi:hypothetical protein